MNEKNLPTKKQKELLSYIEGFIQGNGYGPSYREIMRALDYKSVSTVAIHIDSLIAKGYLYKRDHSARSLEVVDPHSQPSGKHVEKQTTSPHEAWLTSEITAKIDGLKTNNNQQVIKDINILTAALGILQLHNAHKNMQNHLNDVIKQLDQTPS